MAAIVEVGELGGWEGAERRPCSAGLRRSEATGDGEGTPVTGARHGGHHTIHDLDGALMSQLSVQADGYGPSI